MIDTPEIKWESCIDTSRRVDYDVKFDIEPVFKLVWNSVFAFCRRTFPLMDSAQLEDICSEAIFKSLHAFHYSMGGDPVRSFISCAMTVARHVATACYRKQQRRVIVDPEVLEDQLATPTEQTVSDLYDALSRVDQIDAQVLRHYYFDGLSDREIGLELEFSRKKVSRIRRRALRSLRAEYLGESPMILDE